MALERLFFLAIILSLAGVIAYLYATCAQLTASGTGGSWQSNGISESSSGTLFRAVPVHKYTGPKRFASWRPATPVSRPVPRCKNWAVTTTIFPPTTTVKQIAALPDWCLVIAGDLKTPSSYNVSGNAHYLSPTDQERMEFATKRLLRWNHFGRKNLGFIYAIQQGARWVYDTDDDNELKNMAEGIPLPRTNALIEEVASAHKLYNLYPQMSTNPHSVGHR